MTSGRFHLNGEASGSSEQNSSTSSNTTTATNTTGVASVGSGSGAAAGSGTVDIRENEKIRTFVFTSRGSSSSLQRVDRTHPAAAAVHIEELEIKIPEVRNKIFY